MTSVTDSGPILSFSGMQVRRIATLKALSEQRAMNGRGRYLRQEPSSPSDGEDSVASLRRRVSAAVLGAKGNALDGEKQRAENPVPRLKLLLVSTETPFALLFLFIISVSPLWWAVVLSVMRSALVSSIGFDFGCFYRSLLSGDLWGRNRG
jgi:hypothetical protein